MNTGIMNVIAAADDKAQYDTCAKRLIGQKMILAHILVKTVDEFKGLSPEDVVNYIEGEPQIGIVPVNPGMTNTYDEDDVSGERIKGLNTEDSEINEGMIRFDIIFYVRMREGRAQIIINVEIQKNQPGNYKLLNRSIYYVSRMVSSQKDRDFVKSNYDDMKRVFSIWICLNMKENSLDRYYLTNEKILGNCYWEGKQDLLNIVFIGVTKKLPEKNEKNALHRLLGALLSKELSKNEKFEIIKMEYNILLGESFREDVESMCNLSQGIVDDTKIEIILNMYENHFTLEQIALATKKSIEEVKMIIAKEATLV